MPLADIGRPAITAARTLAYSVFQQGAGLINAVSAVNSSATGLCQPGTRYQRRSDGNGALRRSGQPGRQRNYYIMDHAQSLTSTRPLPTFNCPRASKGPRVHESAPETAFHDVVVPLASWLAGPPKCAVFPSDRR